MVIFVSAETDLTETDFTVSILTNAKTPLVAKVPNVTILTEVLRANVLLDIRFLTAFVLILTNVKFLTHVMKTRNV